MIYAFRWWLGGLVARFTTLVLFQGVEVTGDPDSNGPRLIVANHFGGLVDAITVVRAIGGLPHIVAKSTLFKRLPLRLVLRALGVVPVYRQMDHSDMSKNVSSFDEVAKVLAKGRTVLIFPEGTVTDTQELQKVRTGTARMALRAIETGASNLSIVPLGITYEDKVTSRSRVLVEVGEHISEEEIRELAGGTELEEANRHLVHELTSVIRDRLAAVAPDFGSLVRERTMMLAASIHLRTGMDRAFVEPRMSELRAVAQQLAHRVPTIDGGVFAATGRYQLALTASGLEDHQVQPRPSTSALAAVVLRKGIIVLLLTPLAIAGLIPNLIAILLVVAVGAFVKEPVSKGTARVITGVVVFPISWIYLVVVTDPLHPFLTVLFAILGLVFLILLATQVIDLFEAALAWWAVRTHQALLPDLARLRGTAEGELAGILAAGSTSP